MSWWMKYDFLSARRGKGFMQGLVVTGRPVGEILKKALENGLIVLSAGSDVIRLVPPLVIEKEHIDEMIEKLEKELLKKGIKRTPFAHNMEKAKGVFSMSGVMIALISGALMSIQGVFNTEVTKATSLWVSTSFVQLTALIVCLFAWAFTDRQSFLTLMEVPNKWTLLGGVIGAFITVTVVRSMADLGPARAAMLIVIAQLIVAWVIELFGWFGVERTAFEWRKLMGMGIAIIGVIVFKW